METQKVLDRNSNKSSYIIPLITTEYDTAVVYDTIFYRYNKTTTTVMNTAMTTPIFGEKKVMNKVILREKQWFHS